MTLDLAELLTDWDATTADCPARLVRGDDGQEFLQLRIDAGLMQMHLNGRPDGHRYRNSPFALRHIQHAQRLGDEHITALDWQELVRELNQLNYRRLGLTALAENALACQQDTAAERMMYGAIRDIDACLQCIRLIEQRPGEQLTIDDETLPPTLVFHRTRLLAQLRIVQERYEEAIEIAAGGAEQLIQAISERDPEAAAEQDPGVLHLQQMSSRLRHEYHIPQTLREQLQRAVDAEDFATAAILRNQLKSRSKGDGAAEFSPDYPI